MAFYMSCLCVPNDRKTLKRRKLFEHSTLSDVKIRCDLLVSAENTELVSIIGA